MSLAFTCESTLSEDPLNTATFEFDVTFEDECYNANVFEPIVYDYTVPLYAPAAVSFTPSLVSMSCGAVYTEIVSVTPTNEFTPGFTVDDTNGLIIFDPATRPQAQQYTIYIRSCIVIQNDPINPGTDTSQVCSIVSKPMSVTVEDPCFSTTILSEIFAKMMKKPQLQDEYLNIFNEMPTNTWPWTTQVQVESDPIYGQNLCEVVQYQVFMVDSDPNNPTGMLPTDLVTIVSDANINNWQLYFNPTLAYMPRVYDMYLVGQLPSPYSATVRKMFQVEVLDCVATIDISNVVIPPMTNMWYYSPAEYPINFIASQVIQTPACNYNYVYGAFWIPTGETEYFQLPKDQIAFNGNTFSVQKCHQIGENKEFDPDCNNGMIPSDLYYNMRLRIFLNDANIGFVNSEVYQDKAFQVEIKNVCLQDEMSFSSSLTEILIPPYPITTPATDMAVQWIVGQSYPLCPHSCSITEQGTNTVPDFVTNFNLVETIPSANGNPSI